MPSGKNWVNFIFINIAFALAISALYYLIFVNEIKANWPAYRCNPLYMPLSDDIRKDFTYCIQTMQSSYMGFILQPITYLTSSLGNTMGNFMNEINAIRGMFNKIRTFISTIIQSIFGVFLNLIIEFQRITIAIKDLLGKTIGILTTLLFTLDGSIKTINSTWNGPPGQMVRKLGKCFHPDTKIKLQNGSIKTIQNICLGDVLENGSVVDVIMNIDNTREPEKLYVIEKSGVDGEDIFVTGSHLIFNKDQQIFVTVKNHPDSKLSDKQTDKFSCLITSNHQISIGKYNFWDWEDHFIKSE